MTVTWVLETEVGKRWSAPNRAGAGLPGPIPVPNRETISPGASGLPVNVAAFPMHVSFKEAGEVCGASATELLKL